MKTCSIGLFLQGDEKWIAGIIYLHNLIRSIKLLPANEQPGLHLIYNQWIDPSFQKELGGLAPSGSFYSHRQHFLKRYKLKAALKSLKNKHWPISLESLIKQRGISVLFPLQSSLGNSFSIPWIGWIPDFQHKRLPQFFSKEEYAERDSRFLQLIHDSSHIVVSSEDAYQDLMRWFPTDPKRVSILRYYTMPVESWSQADPCEVVKEYQLPSKFLMFPSQFWKHKNHKVLFEALSILKKEGVHDIALVLTGFQKDYRHPEFFDSMEKLIEEKGLSKQIYMLGLLPRDKQIQLMRQAAAIVQPSYFEGWSSLVEDCRLLGKTIYVSDIPIHREQEPPFSHFFNSDHPQELAALIKRDWPHLVVGPDLKREEEALIRSQELGKDYARQFLKIVSKAIPTSRAI